MATEAVCGGRIILHRDFETIDPKHEPLAYRGDAARSLLYLTKREMDGEVGITQNRMQNLPSDESIDLVIAVRDEESARRIKGAVLDYLWTHSGEFLGSLKGL